MAAITSAGSGNWNSTTVNAPWPSGIVPVSGDTVTIANGHTITIPSGYTAVVGSSPADDTGTPAIQTASAAGTGILAIADGGSLTFKGPVRQGAASWTIGAGCTITHDSSGAAVPASAHYTWLVGQTSGTSTTLTITGTSGSPTTFGIAASSGACGGFAGSTTPGNRCGQIIATAAHFADWGTSTLLLARPNLTASGNKTTFDADCTFDRCGAILANQVVNGCDYIFDGTFRSPAGTQSWGVHSSGNLFSANPTTGTRRISGYVEGSIVLSSLPVFSPGGVDVGPLVAAGTPTSAPFTSGAAMTVKSWNNVLVYNRCNLDAFSSSCFGTLNRTILLRTNGGTHFMNAIQRATTYDGWIAEVDWNISETGDIFSLQTNTVGTFPFSCPNGLMIPCPDGSSIGAVTNLSDSNPINGTTRFGPQVTYEHCTLVAGAGSVDLCTGAAGENNNGAAGLYQSVRANLHHRATSGSGYIARWIDAQIATLVAGTYVNCDYNGYYNITGERYYGATSLNPAAYSTAPGTHDVATGDPAFVDDTRRFLTWAQSVDATVTSWADALTRFSTGAAGFTVSACYDWIRAGWVPTNTAVNTSYPGDANQYLGFAAAPATGGVPDLTQLPVANRQRPDWATYLALDPTSQVAGWSYTDPTTGVRIRKVTDATYPAANTGTFHDYAAGGPYVSRVWTGGDGLERVTLHLLALGGTGYLVDVVLGATGGVENERLAPAQPTDTATSWSTLLATPRVWYAMDGTVLRRYDTANADVELTTSAFPKDLSASFNGGATWLTHSTDEAWFAVVDNGDGTHDPAVILYHATTGDVTVFATADIAAGETINEGYLSPSGRYLVLAMNSGNLQVHDTVTGLLSGVYAPADETLQLSHYSIVSDGTTEWLASCNPYGSIVTMGNLPLVPITVAGQVLSGANIAVINQQTAEHTAAQWTDGNTEGYQLAYSVADVPVILASPTLDSGATYTFSISAGYPSMLAAIGVQDVVALDANKHVTASLTNAASSVGMPAGSFHHTLGSSTLYVRMPDDSAPTSSTVQAFAPPLAMQAAFAWNMAGTDQRLLFHTYNGWPVTGSYNIFKLGNDSWGVDGRVVPFVTTSGRAVDATDSRGDIYLAEMPTTDAPLSVADHLALTTEPSASTVSGQAHAQQPAGVIQDASNATVTSDTSTVTAAWVSETGSGSAQGTLTAVAVAGAWAFTNLGVTSALGCTGHWHFTDGSLTGVDSATVTITAEVVVSASIVAYPIYYFGG